jgi:hypothetical protein
VTGLLGKLVLGNVQDDHVIAINTGALAVGSRDKLLVVLGCVADTDLYTNGLPISSLTATEWTNGDPAEEQIVAPWIGRITITGRRASPTHGIQALAGDFDVGLTLSGVGVGKGPSLSNVSIAGSVTNATWKIDGEVRTIRVTGRVSGWQLQGNASGLCSVRSLTLGDVSEADVAVEDVLGAVKAQRWANGTLSADSMGSLQITGYRGDLRRGIVAVPGDFGAVVDVRGENVLARRRTLNSASIAGDLAGSLWKVGGDVGMFRVVGTASGSVVRASGSIATVTLGAADGSDFLAGVDVDGQGRYAAVDGDFVNPQARIGVVSFRGLPTPPVGSGAVAGDANRYLVDSNFTAGAFGTISLVNVDFGTGDSGFHAFSGNGQAAFRLVRCIDKVNRTSWSWSSRLNIPSPAPEGFFVTV